MTDPLLPRSEREQTDESLRLERDSADRALDDEVSEADATADAVISRARARADALLAAARRKTDQTSMGDQPTDTLKTSRAMEDHILQRERVTADHALHRERSEHVRLLSQERQATDHDLSHERARSDKALAMRDDFMGIVSHDLLNLLNAVVGISWLIEKEVAQEHHVERVVAHARRVQRSGARMGRLKLEAVFDRFVQLKKYDRRGVGLGLFISKSIVKGHGGRMWVENSMGRGSTFCFTLPVGASAGDARTGDRNSGAD